MSEVYVRTGDLRQGYAQMYHETWDCYHPIIGDKATMYYLYLVRFRNNEKPSRNYGKSWRGRKGVIEKFQIGYATMPLIDELLKAVRLVDIELRPSGNGADKIYYTVHDPLIETEFKRKEEEFAENVRKLIITRKEYAGLVGKEFRKSVKYLLV